MAIKRTRFVYETRKGVVVGGVNLIIISNAGIKKNMQNKSLSGVKLQFKFGKRSALGCR